MEPGEAQRFSSGPGEAQRIDLWLWHARFAKTRSLAQALIGRGKVRINRVRIQKAAQMVKRGDVVTLSLGPRIRVIEIRALAVRRGPASEAAGLFHELTDARDATTACGSSGVQNVRSVLADMAPTAVREPGAGRPTKRERRQIDRLKPV